ncbi:hypothetical protein SESBI_01948 [Sesbania bispinosa]|nr:hypothetical protein SESBI_01948 [Sesbania bispinosa]
MVANISGNRPPLEEEVVPLLAEEEGDSTNEQPIINHKRFVLSVGKRNTQLTHVTSNMASHPISNSRTKVNLPQSTPPLHPIFLTTPLIKEMKRNILK